MKYVCSAALALLSFLAGSATADWRAETERALLPVLANPPADGLLVFEAVEDGQAFQAGLRPGDVITHYDGQPVASLLDLSRIARSVFGEQRKLLVLARRGAEELQAEFDPAPLGVRLTPVKEREARLLWRAETPIEFSAEQIENALKTGERWELIEHRGETVGWAHSYLAPYRDRMVLRVQSGIKNEQVDQNRDVIVTFRTEKYFPVESIRLTNQNKLAFDFYRSGDVLAGERAGIPDSAPIPDDAVSAYLVGYIAGMMPREKDVCLRCSYLADSSLHAAPFSDIYCLGEDTVEIGDEEMTAYRYEHTVFGERTAFIWVDDDGDVLMVRYANGIVAKRSSFVDVLKAFPDAGEAFPPIDRLPNLEPVPAVQAN